MTLKSRLGVTQGHWKWHHSKGLRFFHTPLAFDDNYYFYYYDDDYHHNHFDDQQQQQQQK